MSVSLKSTCRYGFYSLVFSIFFVSLIDRAFDLSVLPLIHTAAIELETLLTATSSTLFPSLRCHAPYTCASGRSCQVRSLYIRIMVLHLTCLAGGMSKMPFTATLFVLVDKDPNMFAPPVRALMWAEHNHFCRNHKPPQGWTVQAALVLAVPSMYCNCSVL